jgi:steroid delta-isomerase-like uncharacterized protein
MIHSGGDNVMADIMRPIDTFYRVYNEGAFELWNDAVSEDYAAEVNGHLITDRDVGLGFVKTFRQGFPDLRYTVHDQLVDGDKATIRWTASGTHEGEFFGNPATNKQITMLGITIFQVEGGKIVKLWNVWDLAGLLGQLKDS